MGKPKNNKKKHQNKGDEEEEQKELLKFPRTAHLFDAGGSAMTRDDLLSDAASQFMSQPVVIEEKVDGANVGFSFSDDGDWELRAQNRSHWICETTAKQFSGLEKWKQEHREQLVEILGTTKVLYGEWCYARHSLYYTNLPAVFIAFDIYDRETRQFLSTTARNSLLQGTGIPIIRRITPPQEIIKTRDEWKKLLLETASVYYDGPVEGLYIRIEDEAHLQHRCKLVRPDFIQNIETHWMKETLVKNIIVPVYE
eukprot:GFYU01002606.1.p1 GENE.GFYU01002606.1~~GFYU01002606.1.p1  ORF type:complete len:254 (-),score=60.42 GFYU01002606.1:243-1004(-)